MTDQVIQHQNPLIAMRGELQDLKTEFHKEFGSLKKDVDEIKGLLKNISVDINDLGAAGVTDDEIEKFDRDMKDELRDLKIKLQELQTLIKTGNQFAQRPG
jgi:hypothetical protein